MCLLDLNIFKQTKNDNTSKISCQACLKSEIHLKHECWEWVPRMKFDPSISRVRLSLK